MPRKRHHLNDDDSSASSVDPDDEEDQFDPEDADLAAERELFRNPYQRGKKGGKRRKKDGGMWDEGLEPEFGDERGEGKRGKYYK
jgi:hypothetical protein